MYGSIVSKEVRAAGNIVNFNVDHSNFGRNAPRIVTSKTMIGGSVVRTDWGFSEGNRVIILSNLLLSSDIFDILDGMKEDNTNTFYFCYGDNVWNVVIQNISGAWNGTKYNTVLSLYVISKLE